MNSDSQDRLTTLLTADGSATFFSNAFGEAFHSIHGARQEAEAKFVLPARIREKAARQDCVNIIDVCYGLGYNSAAAIACIDALGSRKPKLQIVALENNWQVPKAAIASGLLDIWPQALVQHLKVLAATKGVKTDRIDLSLLIGDARQTSQNLPKTWADAIFLDPFSPPRCPQLWTVEFVSVLASCLKPDGYIVTYSCAAAARTAMLAAGLEIGSSSPVGRKAPGTVAAFPHNDLPLLTEAEKEILQTRAAVPYRDPHLRDPAAVIIQRRQVEQSCSNLESTSAWKRKRRQRD